MGRTARTVTHAFRVHDERDNSDNLIWFEDVTTATLKKKSYVAVGESSVLYSLEYLLVKPDRSAAKRSISPVAQAT